MRARGGRLTAIWGGRPVLPRRGRRVAVRRGRPAASDGERAGGSRGPHAAVLRGERPAVGGTRPVAGRRARPWLAVPLLAALLAGCGIRATQVPTDFGPAPSRMPCALSGADLATQAARGVPVQVFLLCASQLVTVDRSVRIPDGTAERQRRVLVAQGLLDQLATTPSPAEKQTGYTTDVAGGITVSGPRGRDPEDTFRLSSRLQDLTSSALAQIVCTFADSEATAADDGTVVLGGPDDRPLRRYRCTPSVRSHPGAVAPPSTEVTGE